MSETDGSISTQVPPSPSSSRSIKVVVATSVMLSFISFWRAAAIVLNDLGSSAFYAGGIAEQAIGHSAPWFILAVILFANGVRAIYLESCGMFTRGGVYRVVKTAMGSTLGKVSVSALMFDYILTGPISGVSAGQYIVGWIAQTMTYFGHPWAPDKDSINLISAGIAILITGYFWWRNTRGIHESSDDALKIMKVVTVMAVILFAWSGITMVSRPETRRLPPVPIVKNLSFTQEAVGWIPSLLPGKLAELPPETPSTPESHEGPHFGLPEGAGMLLGLIGILIAFGHSVLAMSGEESLAQVNRELEHPKHKNLLRAALVIMVYSLLFTGLVSFLAYAIIPDEVRPQYFDNLISGIAIHLVGPTSLKLAFQGFIVLVGFLMLAGAVNTAIIGSNGVLNRVSEDGVLTDWFRQPHRRYGTTYRMINMIVALQLATIIASRGNVFVLGEAYAFGVIWSFALKGLAMLVLRFRRPGQRLWRVPGNVKLGPIELPLGLGVIALTLFTIAVINLLTKQVATVSGVAFTLIFFLMFWYSDHLNRKKRGSQPHVEVDHFKLDLKEEVSTTRSIRPGNSLCLVRDYNTLEHVRYALEQTNTDQQDLVILTIRHLTGPDTGYENLSERDLFTSYEQLLFSRVVALAEKAGKHVELMVVPSPHIFQAIAITACQLKSSRIIAGRSAIMQPEHQALLVGEAWEHIPSKPDHTVSFQVIDTEGGSKTFYLGAHAPDLYAEDIELIHRLWLEISKQPGHEEIHHRDVVTYALLRLQSELNGPHRQAVVKQLGRLPLDR